MTAREAHPAIGSDAWTSALEIRQLRAFVSVHEHGSVKRAAAALGLAQSTVSESLSALETAAGARVLRRRRGGHEVTLTEAGAAILPHAQRILQELVAAHNAIASATRHARSVVDVAANESVSTYLLPPAMHELRARWPNIRLSVTVGACADVRSAVKTGRSALGLMLRATGAGDLSSLPPDSEGSEREVVLHHDIRLVVFASTAHPLARSRQIGPFTRDDIGEFPVFLADAAGDFHDLVRRWFEADGLPFRRLEPVGSIDAVKRAVKADAASLGVLPSYTLTHELDGSHFTEVKLQPAFPRVQLIAMLPTKAEAVSPVAIELIEQLGVRPG